MPRRLADGDLFWGSLSLDCASSHSDRIFFAGRFAMRFNYLVNADNVGPILLVDILVYLALALMFSSFDDYSFVRAPAEHDE